MAKARPWLVVRDPRSEEISSQSLGSLVNPENTDERKEVEIAAGNSMRSASRSEIGYPQESRQENVPMAAGKAGGRINSKHTVMRENIVTPIAQGDLCLLRQHQNSDLSVFAKEIGNVSKRRNILNANIQNKCIDMGKFMSSSMKAAIHLVPNYLANSKIYKYRKCEEIVKVCSALFRQKWVRKHSEEILNVKCLEYSSPSWARSVLSHDQAIKWAKAQVCVYAESVLCVGQMKDSPEAIERWRGQVEGIRLYSPYQVAVGIDGEAIEFEWKMFPGFSSLSILQEFRDQIIFVSMFNDID